MPEIWSPGQWERNTPAQQQEHLRSVLDGPGRRLFSLPSQADALLRRSEAGLAEVGTHLLESDNAFRQRAAAHALRAGNEGVVIQHIARELTERQAGVQSEIYHGTFRSAVIPTFLATRVEVARRSVASSMGLLNEVGDRSFPTTNDLTENNSLSTDPAWPPVAKNAPLRHYVQGLSTGLLAVTDRVRGRYEDAQASPDLSQDSKSWLNDYVGMGLTEVDAEFGRYADMTDGSIIAVRNTVLPPAYERLKFIAHRLGVLSVEVTMPVDELSASRPGPIKSFQDSDIIFPLEYGRSDAPSFRDSDIAWPEE